MIKQKCLGAGVIPGAILAISSIVAILSAHAEVDVLSQHNDNARTGVNPHEVVLTPATVNKAHFGMLFKRSVDDQLYTQPLIVTRVKTHGGIHDVVYVTTVNNSVYAFDANDPIATEPLWHVNFGTPPEMHEADASCSDMNGDMGIVGTPVIDKIRGVLYVVAETRTGDATSDGKGYTQRLHELDLATGTDLPESPVTIDAPGFNALRENQRPALALASGDVYVGYASHCDDKPYHGYLLAYDAKTLKQAAVFNSSPSGYGASIWQSGQAPSIDANGDVWVVTGNGTWDGIQNFSESFLKLSPDLKLLDWFTPTNHFELDAHDVDLDSSGPTLIPGSDIVLGGGKAGVMYLLDRNHLGHLGDENALEHFSATASHLHSIVYWVSEAKGPLLFVWGQRDVAKVYRFKNNRVETKPMMVRDIPNNGHPGAMLSLSSNAGKDGILWAAIHATGDSWHESRPGVLHAYEADDIRHELWNSLEVAARDNCANYSKMAPPSIANGKVYLASFGNDNVGSGELCVYGPLPSAASAKPAAPQQLTVEKLTRDTVQVTWNPVESALFYRVLRSNAHTPAAKIVAAGLVATAFVDRAPDRGDPATYRVIAVSRTGGSSASRTVEFGGPVKQRKTQEE